MKQMLKMKQTFNKFSLGIFFVLVFGFMLIPNNNANAMLVAVQMDMNGGGGGGGGGSTGGDTGGTTTPALTGAISLTVSPDKSTPYVAGSNMVLSATASVAVCSNTSLNLKVTGDISGPETKSAGTFLDQSAVGGQLLAVNSNVTLPKTPGTYKFNITATRYDQSGLALQSVVGSKIMINAVNFKVISQGSPFYINSNYRGKITSITNSAGYNVSLNTIAGDVPGNDGLLYDVVSIGADPIKTYSTSFDFTISAPAEAGLEVINKDSSGQSENLDVDSTTKKTVQGVKYDDNSVTIKWSAANFPDNSKVICTLPNGPQSKGVVSGFYDLNKNLIQDTKFSFTCTDETTVIPPSTTVGSSCTPSSNAISESLLMHTLQGTDTMTSWDGKVHHAYSVWVTSNSVLSKKSNINVTVAYRLTPNYSGAATVSMLDCLTLSIPAGGDTSNKISVMAIDGSVNGGVSSSSYVETTNVALSASEISSYLTSPTVKVSSGTYYGNTNIQNLYDYSVNTNHIFPGDLYVEVKGSFVQYPYPGAALAEVKVNETFVIGAGGTTSAKKQAVGMMGGVGVISAYYIQ